MQRQSEQLTVNLHSVQAISSHEQPGMPIVLHAHSGYSQAVAMTRLIINMSLMGNNVWQGK